MSVITILFLSTEEMHWIDAKNPTLTVMLFGRTGVTGSALSTGNML